MMKELDASACSRYIAPRRRLAFRDKVYIRAVISRNGTIENLQVLSGHSHAGGLQFDAGETLALPSYFLNREPVEVETAGYGELPAFRRLSVAPASRRIS